MEQAELAREINNQGRFSGSATFERYELSNRTVTKKTNGHCPAAESVGHKVRVLAGREMLE